MFRVRVLALLCLTVVAASGCSRSTPDLHRHHTSAPPASGLDAGEEAPKYVVLFIGDGMGFAQVELAERYLQTQEDRSLRMNLLPVRGQIHTHSADNDVTDSAAGATALATGVKTNNGVINQTPDGERLVPIASQFLDAGRGVGVLTSVQINHATPACFFAHADHRNLYTDIALQVEASGVHMLAGRAVNSEDDRKEEILSAWKQSGIAVVEQIAAGRDVSVDRRLIVLDRNLADPESEEAQLSDAVELAIERLQHSGGFFMMVEGGAIDWKGHSNDGWGSLQETLAFDRALEVAYRFYQEHPDDTLIVVTADHETGGMQLGEELDFEALQRVKEQEEALSQALPEDVQDLDAEVIEQAVREAMGFDELTDTEREVLAATMNYDEDRRRRLVIRDAGNLAEARAGVTWTTGAHTGVDVPVMAVGAGSQRFAGTYDNTQIPRRIRQIALPGLEARPATAGQQLDAALASGTVTGTGEHGNIYTSIGPDQYEPMGLEFGEEVRLIVGGTSIDLRVGRTYTDVFPGEPVAVLHREGLTFAVRDGDFSATYGVRVGDPFQLSAIRQPGVEQAIGQSTFRR